jgi:hypothetical protein
MTPQRLQHLPVADTVLAVGSVTVGSILLEMIANANLILIVLFVVSVILNFTAGTMCSFAKHRRGGEGEKWFSAQLASYGLAKKFALLLFVPLAGIVDGLFMLVPVDAAAQLANYTPTMKGVLVGLTGAQVIGAAKNLHFVVGDDAIPALAVLIRAVDEANVGGSPPRRRTSDILVDAHLPPRKHDEQDS